MEITLNAVLVSVIFLVPGYVGRLAQKIFGPVPNIEPMDEKLLNYLSFSIYAIAITTILLIGLERAKLFYGISLIDSFNYGLPNQIKISLSAFSVLIILHCLMSPILLGLIFGYFLPRIPRSNINQYDNTWIEFFSSLRDTCIVYLNCKDGQNVAGIFGDRSFVSLEQKNNDLFLEQEIHVDESGMMVEIIKESRGIWLRQSDISLMKIFDINTLAEKKDIE
ncbi:MAG: DUF6338 family protein [Candidatus Glassbacteria bacterium]